MSYIEQLGKNAQKASKTLISLGSLEKNKLLRQVATALVEQAEVILAENARDLAAAKENGISDIMLDRLRLNHERIKGIAEGVGQVADLQDPIGQVVRGYTNLDGLKIVQKRVPLGVVAMIFEAARMFRSMRFLWPLKPAMPLFCAAVAMPSIPIPH